MGKRCPNPACGAYTAEEGAAFCSRCATPLAYAPAPTQVNPALAPSWAPSTRSASPPARRGVGVGVAVGAALVVLAVGGGVLFVAQRPTSAPAAPQPAAPLTSSQPEQRAPPVPAAAPTPVAVATPTPAPAIPGWLSSVHYHSPAGVDLHPGDLDAADGRCARLTGAMITLEAPGGDQFVSDGDPQHADLELRLGAPAGGTYDVELGVGHNRFVAVGSGLTGSQSIDLDRLGQRVARFVRISTRRTGSTVCLDSVLVARRVPPA